MANQLKEGVSPKVLSDSLIEANMPPSILDEIISKSDYKKTAPPLTEKELETFSKKLHGPLSFGGKILYFALGFITNSIIPIGIFLWLCIYLLFRDTYSKNEKLNFFFYGIGASYILWLLLLFSLLVIIPQLAISSGLIDENAIKLEKVEICTSGSADVTADSCLYSLAYRNSGPFYCKYINNPGQKQSCIAVASS